VITVFKIKILDSSIQCTQNLGMGIKKKIDKENQVWQNLNI